LINSIETIDFGGHLLCFDAADFGGRLLCFAAAKFGGQLLCFAAAVVKFSNRLID
jgi:hypothetical protein